MSQLQMNKQYIRQRVVTSQQAAFYTYFMQLSDFDQFHNWTHERTVQAVRSFHESLVVRSDNKSTETTKMQVSPQPSLTSTANLNPKNYQTQLAGSQSQHSKPTIARSISALNLLEEIEQQMIFTPRKKTLKPKEEHKIKASSLKNSAVSQNKTQESMPNKSQLKEIQPVITKTKQSSQQYQLSKPKFQKQCNLKNSARLEQRFELKRSLELKRHKSDLKNPLDLKSKKKSNSDSLFGCKLNQDIPCRKLTTHLGIDKIQITNHQMVHRYFLPDYAIYHISVIPSNLVIKRTYDGFLELRNILEKMFPCVKIPYLDSSSWFSESDITLINKNKVNLELFLNQMIGHPTLSKTEILRDFLTIPDISAMQTALNNYADIAPAQKLSELANQQGIITVSLSQQNHKLIEQLPLWQKHFENYFDKYIDLVANLTSQYESIQLIFTQLVTLNYDFRLKMGQMSEMRSILGNFGQFQALIRRKQNYFNDKRKQVQQNIDNLKEKYSTTLKYQKLNVSSIQNLVEPVQKLTSRLIQRLQNEPQSQFYGQQTYRVAVKNEKFSQTIWEESKDTSLFKYQVGYLNKKLLEELHIFNTKLVGNLGEIWEQVFQRVQLDSQDLIL